MIKNEVLSLPSLVGNDYKNAYPFPHITIDNFFDETILTKVLEELKDYDSWRCDTTDYVKDYQQNKFYAPDALDLDDINTLSTKAPFTKFALDYFYSHTVLKFLEELTGIKNLVGDPSLLGGGVHKINRGGKLGVHADFNVHFRTQLHRRINLLLYLNKDWDTQWGGDLELWEKDMSKCCIKVAPIFNRAAIFNITDDAFHGHPHPLNTPENVSRYSLALYYYTVDRPEHEKSPWHPVVWKDI